VTLRWLQRNAARFNRVLLAQNDRNSKLGPTRNVAFDLAQTPYIFVLDADNFLLPECLERCLSAASRQFAAFAYPTIARTAGGTISHQPYDANLLAAGNYIDAMALVSKAAWVAAGGYDHVTYGWEDYDFWCRLAERGLHGVAVEGEPLAVYRVHGESMTASETSRRYRTLALELQGRHPWLELQADLLRDGEQEGSDDLQRKLASLAPILRSPTTREPLTPLAHGEMQDVDGNVWTSVAGRPNLFAGMASPISRTMDHVSNPLPRSALELVAMTKGWILNLSAGASEGRLGNVVEVEAALFKHTDIIADAHNLPFADQSFSGALVMNAFEHYNNPKVVAAELKRVLRPGGWILVRTAFLQPLHEEPNHYFNCTRFGLEEWFSEFECKISVPEEMSAANAISWILSEAEHAIRVEISPAAASSFLDSRVGSLVDTWRSKGKISEQWDTLSRLPPSAAERLAAGFELFGRRPPE
jgi:SAM-dependent methyltransferase